MTAVQESTTPSSVSAIIRSRVLSLTIWPLVIAAGAFILHQPKSEPAGAVITALGSAMTLLAIAATLDAIVALRSSGWDAAHRASHAANSGTAINQSNGSE